MAFQALEIQVRDELGARLRETSLRARGVALDFINRLPEVLAERHFISLPLERHALPAFSFPDSPQDLERLLRYSENPVSSRLPLLEGLVNAETPKRGFWDHLLVCQGILNADFTSAESALRRLIQEDADLRLPDGLSMKAAALLQISRLYLSRKMPDKALEVLREVAHCPAPERLPASFSLSMAGTMGLEGDQWPGMILWAWTAPASTTWREGWVETGSGKGLLLKSGVGWRLYAGDLMWKRLASSLAGIGGGAVEAALAASGTTGSVPVEGLEGTAFVVREADGGHGTRLPGIQRLGLGLLLALGGLGLSWIVLLGLKRDQAATLLAGQEQFFRQAAHDLKTPLATMRVLAETLALRRSDSPETENRYLAQLVQETDRAAEVVDQMLLGARLKAGNVLPALEAVSPDYVIGRVLERFTPRLQGWSIGHHPPQGEMVRADPVMFERVIVNLVENIVKHASEGRAMDFRVTRLERGRVEIAVGDRGPGVSVDGAKAESGTRGIGLELVGRIVALHGGEFRHVPREGGGTWAISIWSEDVEEVH